MGSFKKSGNYPSATTCGPVHSKWRLGSSQSFYIFPNTPQRKPHTHTFTACGLGRQIGFFESLEYTRPKPCTNTQLAPKAKQSPKPSKPKTLVALSAAPPKPSPKENAPEPLRLRAQYPSPEVPIQERIPAYSM